MKVLWNLAAAALVVVSPALATTVHAQSVPNYGATYGANYGYFAQDEEQAIAPIADDGHGVGYSDCGGCGGCDSCCDTSCGSCGLALGGLLNPCCSNCAPVRLIGFPCRGLEVGGWTQFGYHTRSNNMFNNRPDELNLHQQWFFIERAADRNSGYWDWGFRGDIVYGIDAQDTQAFGNPNNGPGNDARRWDNPFDHGAYGWAVPQAYLEVARGNLSVIAGHFYTIVGYETVAAPENFFYSGSYARYNSEPFTHTGALATYTVDCCTEVYAGWTLGWDTGFDRFRQGNNFLGGIRRQVSNDLAFTYITTLGDMGRRGSGYTHSFVMEAGLTPNLTYVMQNDLVELNDNNPTGNLNDTIGINNHLIYDFSDCLAAGARLEWWKADGGSLWEMTYGLNIKPHGNVNIRPEVRYDWGNAASAAQLGFPNDAWTFGIDAVVVY